MSPGSTAVASLLSAVLAARRRIQRVAIHLWKKLYSDINLLNQWICEVNLGNLLVRLKENTENSPFLALQGNMTAVVICGYFKTASEFIFNLFLIKMISYISEGLMEAYVLIKCHTAIGS